MKIKYIVIHCSDSPPGRGDDAKEIHRWHRQKGFDGIGYQFVITESGKCEAGRPLYWAGAHAKGHNHESLGICLIGQGEYSKLQWYTLENLVKYLVRQNPKALVVGHNDLDKDKPCPLFNVVSWYKSLEN